ncbi:phage antirepressor KilAC domain-containing protein [Aromatoleum anaerobium]|uniref:Phage regulatory protein/antirepressor Ant n=1 Tax=Aromatoleum anaerobium TaxID=182180 RepID=A0ABX1PUJ3_9RHOO|nr:phage regulatory protein/antirepressor Ant [Aromatoleum anaerobium]MCK0507887.1 phage regulatory protein/antirepressor Ant [Aromatoleum anaerobium]
MNIVTITGGQAVTSSLAIADGTENEHRAVLQLVRTYLADLEEFGRVAFEMRPFETAGGTQKREVAMLNEQQSTLLLTYMRNSDIVRAFKKRLVKAFWELAQRPASDPMQVLNDPAAMRGLLLNYSEKVIALEEKVAEQSPKVEALDRIAVSDGRLNLTNAAKNLDVPPRRLIDWMIANKWIYRRAGGSGAVAYQDKIQSGYLTHKVYVATREDGSEKTCEQVMVLPKGLAKLSMLVPQSGSGAGRPPQGDAASGARV